MVSYYITAFENPVIYVITCKNQALVRQDYMILGQWKIDLEAIISFVAQHAHQHPGIVGETLDL